MEDKYLMETILYGSKVINDLYLHGSIEASNETVVSLFHKALQEALDLHNEIFQAMKTVGFYSTTNVDVSEIENMRQKLECSCDACECEEK